MPNSTPHIENSKVDGGDRVNPVITDITNGGMDNSRIWHTKENDKFFEYRQKKIIFFIICYSKKIKNS